MPRSIKYTKSELISLLNKVHNNKYSYPNIPDNFTVTSYIDIVCPIHGVFNQSLFNHKNKKHGCPECAKQHQSKEMRIERAEWIQRFESVHGKGTYDYSKVPDNISQFSKIEIYCPVHNSFFKKTPELHWRHKAGCPKCAFSRIPIAKRHSYERLARIVHGARFEYSELPHTFYLSDTIILYCNEHNRIFYCNAREHLEGKGCPECPTLNPINISMGDLQKYTRRHFYDNIK